MGFGLPLISFRFHLVSLTAIFLALALGIVLGTTVVERATVSVLESRIKAVREEAARDRNSRALLSTQLKKAEEFGDQVEQQMLAGRLNGVPVAIVATAGVDTNVLDALRLDLTAAGAVDSGLVTLTERWSKADSRLRDSLIAALGVTTGTTTALVAESARRLAAEFAAGGGATLRRLVENGLAQSPVGEFEQVPGPGAMTVIVTDDSVDLVSEGFARDLGVTAPLRAVVTEVGPSEGEDLVLLQALRKERGDAQLSTVDHVDTVPGRIATVLSLAALGLGRTGDYGTASGAERVLPPDR